MTQKRHFTLIEVMVAMLLTSMILTTLTFFYQYIARLNLDIDRIQTEHFEQLYLDNRFSKIIPRTFVKKRNKTFPFLTEIGVGTRFKSGTTSLVFCFDNCVKLDPRFAYEVLGRLFVDDDERLWLAIWPLPTRWDPEIDPPIHKELLMEGVEKFSFEFFIPPRPASVEVAPEEIQVGRAEIQPKPEGTWTKEWSKEYRRLPTMVKIFVTRTKDKIPEEDEKKRTILYAYSLPHAGTHVVYDQ